jgi:hypothetical protein
MTFPSPFDLLVSALGELRAELEPLPMEVSGNRLKPETWITESPEDLALRAARDLPSTVVGVRIDGTPVLFTVLTGDPTLEGVRETLRRVRNQATIARSWLDADAANLQMFLARHVSATRDPLWEEFASIVEADDRVCRKLVWLPTADASGESAKAFFARTFLASPWTEFERPIVATLDVMSGIQLPPGWKAVLEDDALDADSLLRRLAEARAE